jgi:hypothetical protein
MTLDEIVNVVDQAGHATRGRARVHRNGLSRREFLRSALGVGIGFGVAFIGLFPTARPARATHGANIIPESCSGLSFATDDDCNGCQQGRKYCCCSGGYHKDETFACNYLHRPNQCEDSADLPTPNDGWKWQTSLCCYISPGVCRSYRKWRCHDGWWRPACSGSGSTYEKSICRYVVESGSSCAPCPD